MEELAKKRFDHFAPLLTLLAAVVCICILALFLFVPDVEVESTKEDEQHSEDKDGKGKELAIGVANALKEGMDIEAPEADATKRGEPVVSRNIFGVKITDAESEKEYNSDSSGEDSTSENSPSEDSLSQVESRTDEILEDIPEIRGEISELTE